MFFFCILSHFTDIENLDEVGLFMLDMGGPNKIII